MAYDSARGVTVLYGGAASSGGNVPGLRDTWEWDGNIWTQVCAICPPRERLNVRMAYDSARGRVLLFGGAPSGQTCQHDELSDVWRWDGSAWTEVQGILAGPSGRAVPGIAYDGCRARLVVLGGGNCSGSQFDTWTLGLCLADLDNDGIVAVPDLLKLLANWGPCP